MSPACRKYSTQYGIGRSQKPYTYLIIEGPSITRGSEYRYTGVTLTEDILFENDVVIVLGFRLTRSMSIRLR